MTLDIYTPRRLALIQEEESQTVRASNWLNWFFPNSFYSDQEQIMFDKIDASREIAPFMLPNLPGKPIYKRDGERIEMFTPAYTKPKDAVEPGMGMKRAGAELVGRVQQLSPQQRILNTVADITSKHLDGITRLWEYMGARSVIDGSFTVVYPDNPHATVTLDFGRDAGHTITKGAGSKWGEAGVSAWNDLQAWVDIPAGADYGAAPTDVYFGKDRMGRVHRRCRCPEATGPGRQRRRVHADRPGLAGAGQDEPVHPERLRRHRSPVASLRRRQHLQVRRQSGGHPERQRGVRRLAGR